MNLRKALKTSSLVTWFGKHAKLKRTNMFNNAYSAIMAAIRRLCMTNNLLGLSFPVYGLPQSILACPIRSHGILPFVASIQSDSRLFNQGSLYLWNFAKVSLSYFLCRGSCTDLCDVYLSFESSEASIADYWYIRKIAFATAVV